MFDLLFAVAENLTNIQVPYMLSGSFAMSFYSVSRTTRDIDIVAYLQHKDVDNLLRVFEEYYAHRPTIEEEISRNGMFNIISYGTGFKIDFIVLKPDDYSQVAFGRRQLKYLDEKPLYVISIEDLVLAKLKWIQQLYSERQYADICNLMHNSDTDRDYLLYWKDKLNLNTFDTF